MTLLENILKKVQSKESLRGKYASPPPELDEDSIARRVNKKEKKPIHRYPHVTARVDSSSPRLQTKCMSRYLENYTNDVVKNLMGNFDLLCQIKRQYYNRGKVDCHQEHTPKLLTESYVKRRKFLNRVQADNKVIYERILASKARVDTTACLERCWRHNRRRIVSRAELPFVLFSPEPSEDVDPVFLAPPGVRRPRVVISLRVAGGACLGRLTLELFSDVCPRTCRLFADLLRTDGKYSYIGSCFFTKVPQLYWSGGDVALDNGCGCYLPAGRRAPSGAENYHFPHSMPGLVSMRVTRDDETCGVFHVTFKPLPQFDLNNVVFARVVRPSNTYDTMKSFGSALSTHPVVRIESAHFISGKKLLETPVPSKNPSLELLQKTAKELEALAPDLSSITSESAL